MKDVFVTEDETSLSNKPVYLLGRDIREIKCFRNSFIFGICGGFAGGLICFLATSKARFSTHVGFGSLWICVLGYWFPCRYKYESQALKMIYFKEKIEMERKEKKKLMESSQK